MLLASEAWVGVSRRLRTPPSTVLTGGLRATRPRKKIKTPEKKKVTKWPRRKEWIRRGSEGKTKEGQLI